MSLLDFLVKLRELSADPAAPLEEIRQLFASHTALAEYQTGRHFIAQKLGGDVVVAARSLDPRDRMRALDLVRLAFPRSSAGALLRRMVKDPDPAVRARAHGVVVALALDDVAPPDTRYRPDQYRRLGGHNPTGWRFGLFPGHYAYNKKPRPPTRGQALRRYGLPELADRAALCALLGIDADQLTRFMRPGTEAGSGYVEFEIAKARGGARRIAAPRGPLRKAQRKILDEILARIPPHDACHGFVPGRSTVSNAAPHQGAALIVKVDLQDFFPTVHYRRVRGLFAWLGYNDEVAAALAGLTTYRPKLADGRVLWPGVLPQGAPTSPALANLVSRRLDVRLSRLAAKLGAVYTRYADDLTFSFAQPPAIGVGRFLWWVDSICQHEGFLEHAGKRRILRPNNQQRVTGIVVNAGLHVPRADRRRFRAILHNCARHGLASQARGRDDFEAYLAGYAAYVEMIEPALGRRWGAEVRRLLGERDG